MLKGPHVLCASDFAPQLLSHLRHDRDRVRALEGTLGFLEGGDLRKRNPASCQDAEPHTRARAHAYMHTHTHTSGPRRCPRTWSRNFEVYSLLQATPSSSAWEPTMIWSCLAAGEAAGEAGALIAPADALRLSSSPCCSRTCWLPISRNSAPDVIAAVVKKNLTLILVRGEQLAAGP